MMSNQKKGIHPRPCGIINLSNIISYGRGTLPYLIDIVIDADNPDVIINFTKQEKKVCFMTLIIPAIIASALVITLTILKRKIKQET